MSLSYTRRHRAPLFAGLLIGATLAADSVAAAADADEPRTTRPPAVIIIDGDAVAREAPPMWQARKPATQPVAEATLEGWFTDLAASDDVARDAALGKLLELTRGDLPGLRRVVERARPVAPSQAHALRDVVTHVYLSGESYPAEPRVGFLGLAVPTLDSVEVPRPPGERAEPQPNVLGFTRPNSGVPVEHRIPGFCAFRTLRDGDVVLSILKPAPRRLRDWNELTYSIRAFPAGETLTLEVLRRGVIISVPVTLDAKLVVPQEDVWHNVILPQREAAASAYWNQHFAPLIEQRLSGQQHRHQGQRQPHHARAE